MKKGEKMSEDMKQKISASMKNVKRGPFSAEHKRKLSVAKRGIPLSAEHRKNISLSLLENPPFKGRRHTPEALKKMRAVKLGKKLSAQHKMHIGLATKGISRQPFSEEHKRKISAAKLGTICSVEARRKMSDSRRGNKNHMFGVRRFKAKNPNWKGGITPLRAAIRGTIEYAIWRLGVFTRDDFTCQICGVRGGKLEADHYPKKFSEILVESKIKTMKQALRCEELWDICSGRTLCKECHHAVTWGKE